ncbi:1766_t:CDS:2, partial [Paraglomus occultum]
TSTEITNEFQFFMMVDDKIPNDNKMRKMTLSIRVEGMKQYGEWEIGEVLEKVLSVKGQSLDDVPQFDIDKLGEPNPDSEEDAINILVGELTKKLKSFQSIKRNESTAREFISPFLTTAVSLVRDEEDTLILKSEEPLHGSRAYGILDYCIYARDAVILVSEAQNEQFNKGVAQNVMQMLSAVENLKRKRMIDDVDEGQEVPVVMYGIVTNALSWYFFRWGGDEKNPSLERSVEVHCEFELPDMGSAKRILRIIMRILQDQIHGLKNSSE